MKKLLLLCAYATTGLLANSESLHVSLNIYQNKAFLNKTFVLRQTGEIDTIVPAYSNLANIKNILSKGCKIENQTLSDKIIKKDELSNKIKNLTTKKDALSYQINALKANYNLLKSISIKDVNDFSKIDKISSYLKEKIVKNLKETASLKKQLSETESELQNMPSSKRAYKKLNIKYTCQKENSKLKISYPQKDIKYNSFYNIDANTENKTITIEKNANINYTGIENFNKIDFNIYSYTYNKNVAPQTFYPKYLKKQQEVLYKMAKTMALRADSPQIEQRQQISYDNLQTKSFYNIKDASLVYGAKNFLHVGKETLNAKFQTIIDAYGTNKAYLEAIIKTNKNYQSGLSNFSLNDNKIATRRIKRLQKGKKEALYFGEDEHIQIKKELIKTLNDKTFFGDTRVNTQNWSYKITNKKPINVNISFIQRVPVSKDADITVKTTATPKYTKQNANGKTIWNFKLEPKETKNIIFGYEISSVSQ